MPRLIVLGLLALVAAGCGGRSARTPPGPSGTVAVQAGKRLFVAQLDGSHRRLLATLPAPPTTVTWSPDGSRLLAAYSPRQHIERLVVLDDAGKKVAAIPGAYVPDPWSRDGRFLASDSTRDAMDPCATFRHQLSVTLSTSGGRVVHRFGLLGAAQLAEEKPDEVLTLTGVAWSPDDSKLAFVVSAADCVEARDGIGTSTVEILDARTGARRVVYRGHSWTYAGTPSWSPDGRSIAFAGACDTGGINGTGCGKLGVVDVVSGKAHLFETAEWLVDVVRWTGDGRVLAAASSQNDASQVGILEIDPATGHETWLAHAAKTGVIADDMDPSFETSPDGTELITSVNDYFSELTPDGYSGLVATNLVTHEKRHFGEHGIYVGVRAEGWGR